MPAKSAMVFMIKDQGSLCEVARMRIESCAHPADFGASVCADIAGTRFLPTNAEQVALELIKRYLPTEMSGKEYIYDVTLKKPTEDHISHKNAYAYSVKYMSINETLFDDDFSAFKCYATQRRVSESAIAQQKRDTYYYEARKIISDLEGYTLGYFEGVTHVVLRNAARLRKRRNKKVEYTKELNEFQKDMWDKYETELENYKKGQFPSVHLSEIKKDTECTLEGLDEEKRAGIIKAAIDLGNDAGFAMSVMGYCLDITTERANEILQEVQSQ